MRTARTAASTIHQFKWKGRRVFTGGANTSRVRKSTHSFDNFFKKILNCLVFFSLSLVLYPSGFVVVVFFYSCAIFFLCTYPVEEMPYWDRRFFYISLDLFLI